MPLEAKDIAEVFGINLEKIDTVEKLKSFADETFTKTSEAKGSMGQLVGESKVSLKRALKAVGIEVPTEEFEKMKLREAIETYVEKISEKFTGEIDTLKKQVGEPNEEIKKLSDKLGKYEKKNKEYEETINAKNAEVEAMQSKFASEFKGLKIKTKQSESHGKIKFATGANELMRKGFMSHLNESYNRDWDDEKDELIVTDKKGERIKHDKKTGEYMSYDEVIERDLSKFPGLSEINPHAPNNLQQQKQQGTNNNQNNQGAKQTSDFKIAPRITYDTLH